MQAHSPEYDEIVTVLPAGYVQLERAQRRLTLAEMHAVWT